MGSLRKKIFAVGAKKNEDIDNQEDLNRNENKINEEVEVKKLTTWENEKIYIKKDCIINFN